jgi:hypothetical protein
LRKQSIGDGLGQAIACIAGRVPDYGDKFERIEDPASHWKRPWAASGRDSSRRLCDGGIAAPSPPQRSTVMFIKIAHIILNSDHVVRISHKHNHIHLIMTDGFTVSFHATLDDIEDIIKPIAIMVQPQSEITVWMQDETVIK